MLNKLRASATGIFTKILLTLLVLSFAIWGIGDIFRSDSMITNVATVGNIKISAREYQRALRFKMEELRIQFGKSFNAEFLKKIGVGIFVRDELISHALVLSEAEKLGIIASDKAIFDTITSNQAFADKDGNFDKSAYLSTINNRGMTEQIYVSDLRNDIATRLLAETVSNGIIVPNDLIKYVYKARNEQRIADIYQISASSIKEVPQPTEAEIKTYYDAHSKDFMNPEYRSISYIDIKLPDLQAKIDISDDSVKQAYEEKKEEFHKPEKRIVEQMLFEKEIDAKKALENLEHGEKFTDVASKSNLINKGKTSLGEVLSQDLPPENGKEVFALKEGNTTKILKSDFGFHIFYVTKIIPEKTLSLAEAKSDIIRDLKIAKANETIAQIANQTIDNIAGGMKFDEAAAKIGQKVLTINNVSRDGKTLEGKKAALPLYDNFINTAFSIQQNEHSAAVQSSD
ncbi:MAG: SurA N-terminal domain-containing protein, partial [Pseudomonadota bacterium]